MNCFQHQDSCCVKSRGTILFYCGFLGMEALSSSYTTYPVPAKRSNKCCRWDWDTIQDNYLGFNWGWVMHHEISNFTFKSLSRNNRGVKSWPQCWHLKWVWVITFQKRCWHTKHSESHCGPVEQSVFWPALQMDWHTVILLFKERKMKESGKDGWPYKV